VLAPTAPPPDLDTLEATLGSLTAQERRLRAEVADLSRRLAARRAAAAVPRRGYSTFDCFVIGLLCSPLVAIALKLIQRCVCG
jgi:hypothetical protein